MKRILIALAALAALMVSCNEPSPDHLSLIYFTEINFTAENNQDILTSDIINTYKVEQTQISIEFPSGLKTEDLTNLVPTFKVNDERIVVTANGSVVESGKTSIDFSKPVDFLLSFGEDNRLTTVSIKISQPVNWALMASTGTINDTLKSDPVLRINPADNVPYVMGTSKKKVTEQFPVLYKVTGGGFVNVCKSGYLVKVKSDEYGFGFTPEGIPYATFKDWSKPSPYGQSVMKVENGEATYVGDTCALYVADDVPAVFAFSSNDIYVAMKNASNDKACTITKKTLNLSRFDGSAWTQGISLDGRNAENYAYKTIGKKINGINYLYIYNQNVQTVSLYSYSEADKAWKTVFEGLKPKKANGTDYDLLNLRCVDFDVDKQGNPYILVSCQFVSETYNPAVIKYDVATKAQTIIGGVLKKSDVDDDREYSFGLDKFDVPIVAFRNSALGNRLCITSIDAKTKAWTEPVAISAQAVGKPDMSFDANGVGYIAVRNADTYVYEIYAAK